MLFLCGARCKIQRYSVLKSLLYGCLEYTITTAALDMALPIELSTSVHQDSCRQFHFKPGMYQVAVTPTSQLTEVPWFEAGRRETLHLLLSSVAESAKRKARDKTHSDESRRAGGGPKRDVNQRSEPGEDGVHACGPSPPTFLL